MCGHGVEGKQCVTDGMKACEGVTEESDGLIWIAFTGMREGPMDTSELCSDHCVCLAVAAGFHQVSAIALRVVEGCPEGRLAFLAGTICVVGIQSI